MTLQQQVQQHLQNTGISLRELSRRSGVSHTTIGKILRGGTYKSDTANDLIFAMSFYGGDTARPVMQAETLHDKVEAIAADRVDADKGAWDVDLNCAKYRRVMALENELEQAQDVLAQREQHLKSCENALIEANEKIQNVLDESGKQLAELSLQLQKHDAELEQAQEDIHDMKTLEAESAQFLRDANAEIKRLTALSETHGQNWKAASVQVEQLQKQLDHGQAQFKSLHDAYNQQIDDEAEMLAQIDTLFAERETTATLHDQQVMRLRVYVWILIAALVFVVASGLVVWGAK